MMTTPDLQQELSYNLNNLVIWKLKRNRNKRLLVPILVKGAEVFLVCDYSVEEYLDKSTGEILTPDVAKKLYGIKEIDYGVLVMQRQYLLSKLRKEVREFALFVLKFRNKRRGVTPTIRVLCQWYAELNDMLPRNVYKYVTRLQEAGILSKDNPDVMAPLFQISGNNTTAKSHLSEMSNATALFIKLLIEKSIHLA